MNGRIAKKLRKLVFALQVQKKVPATEHRQHNGTGQVRCFGARAAYRGMKRAYMERGGFVVPPVPVLPEVARKEVAAKARRTRKQLARARRALAAREAHLGREGDAKLPELQGK
jgi:predicted anti-sigma-YlaC factor YlaD